MLKRNVFITAAKGNKLLLVAIIVFLVIALPSVYVFEKKYAQRYITMLVVNSIVSLKQKPRL